MNKIGIWLDSRENITIIKKGSTEVKIRKSNNVERWKYTVILCGNNLA
jgi:hypothetical protein